MPVKRLLQGAESTSVNRDAAADEGILDWYIDFAQRRTSSVSDS
jgi:hypothetical protein